MENLRFYSKILFKNCSDSIKETTKGIMHGKQLNDKRGTKFIYNNKT